MEDHENGECEKLRNVEECKELICESDTKCGFWIFKWKWLQFFASKKSFLVILGIVTCFFAASYPYFVATLTTIEKQYKLTSQSSGFILSSHDIAQVFSSVVLTYYCAKGHLPRWISVALMIVVSSFFLTALAHFIYGPGRDVLSLTQEYGGSIFDGNKTQELIRAEQLSELCYENKTITECNENDGDEHMSAVVYLWCVTFITGLGGPLFYTLGITYMDNNVKRSLTPLLLSVMSTLRQLATPVGYALAAYCLKFWVSPELHPTITNDDPRWIGNWWVGWIIFGIIIAVTIPMFACIPRILPRAAVRKTLILEKLQKEGKSIQAFFEKTEAAKPSLQDLMKTFRRLSRNKVFVYNNLAAVFYLFGFMPFYTYKAKFIEVQYLVSPSVANAVTGLASLIFSSSGMLLGGIVISKFKPKARYLAAWNIFTSVLATFGIITYALVGCKSNNNSIIVANSHELSNCNMDCNCDYVKYSPICGENNVTYISACHAGCRDEITLENGTKLYNGCECVLSSVDEKMNFLFNETSNGSTAKQGVCLVDCKIEFYLYIIVLCIHYFFAGTEGSANFLLGIRCIDEKDKNLSIGLTLSILSLFALVPSPILFGWIIDSTCILWGKTCGGTGNCWLYDTIALRYNVNFVAAVFVVLGTLSDIGTWYHAKNVKIFDEEIEIE